MCLYRVAQEALTNVMKHAPGTPTSLRLAFGTEQVSLTVDNMAPARRGGNGGSTALGHGSNGLADSYGSNGLADSHGSAGVAGPAGATPDGAGFLALSGGGYGLPGIVERVALLGGHVEAGPTAGGWRVEAVVPLVPPVPAVEQRTVEA
jgi:signal transduction histidine kinase